MFYNRYVKSIVRNQDPLIGMDKYQAAQLISQPSSIINRSKDVQIMKVKNERSNLQTER